MQFRFTHIALLAALAAGPLWAQETTPEAPAAEEGETTVLDGQLPLSMGEEVSDTPAPAGLPRSRDEAEVGQEYLVEEIGDWQLLCAKAENERDPCQLYQLLRDSGGGAVAEFSIFNIPNGKPAVAGATAVTPLGTLLSQQISLRVDSGQAKRYPFTFCLPNGCFARIGFAQADVDAFRRGNTATVTIVPLAAPDQKVDLTLSLSGFTKGFQRVVEINAENAQKAQPAASE